MARPKSPSGSKRKVETSPANNAAAHPTVDRHAEPNTSIEAQPATTPPVTTQPVQAQHSPTQPGKTNGAREGAKLAVVKTESRATVMPINMEEEIRRRAYELSERRGFSSGHETEDWPMAESEVLQRYRQHSA